MVVEGEESKNMRVCVTHEDSRSIESFDDTPLRKSDLTVGDILDIVDSRVVELLKVYEMAKDKPTKSKRPKAEKYWDKLCERAWVIFERAEFLYSGNVKRDPELLFACPTSNQLQRFFGTFIKWVEKKEGIELGIHQYKGMPGGYWIVCEIGMEKEIDDRFSIEIERRKKLKKWSRESPPPSIPMIKNLPPIKHRYDINSLKKELLRNIMHNDYEGAIKCWNKANELGHNPEKFDFIKNCYGEKIKSYLEWLKNERETDPPKPQISQHG